MEFDGDAFISYAHLDNQELVEGHKGWVANLHRALEVRVGQLLGKKPEIWRDPKLQGNDLFAETLIERLRRVAVLVAVVSPRYLKSEWTLRELTEFWHAAEEQGGIRVRDKARVFKVLKTPVSYDKTPPELRSLLGYEFFKVDPETGKIRELDEVFGPDAQRDFWLRLDDLAHDICNLLEVLESPPGETTGATNGQPKAVFLAETTSDLREQREALKRDLQQHGYLVLPDRPMSFVAAEVVAAVREDLARCRMSVHLVGGNYSLVPEGGLASLLEIQNDLAIERAAKGSFSRLLWIPPGLQVQDERQKQVLERIRFDPRIGPETDVLETCLEDLRTQLWDWLQSDPRRPDPHERTSSPRVDVESGPPSVYLIYDQRDTELAGAWADGLFDADVEVIRSAFDGTEAEIREYHQENLATCDGALILFGSANECWLRRKLREVQKSAGYGRTKPGIVTAISLIQPRTPDKERFRTHEALVVTQWEGFSSGALSGFLSRLKGGGGRRPA